MSESLRPVLVLPVYRGGERFERALKSLTEAEGFFRRVVISVNGSIDGEDSKRARDFVARTASTAEVICTGKELPWMEHQRFWMQHLEETGCQATDWLYWFAHDDELYARGISTLVDGEGNWPLQESHTYLGPWAMQHEDPNPALNDVPENEMEFWTSFPGIEKSSLPVAEWVAQQFTQPTYINFSGCVTTLQTFQSIRDFRFPKPGGMRIEMAVAAAPHNKFVSEFRVPTVITYGRSNSDRTRYSRVARKDDRHIMVWLVNYLQHHPSGIPAISGAMCRVGLAHLKRIAFGRPLPQEEWRVRGIIER